MKALLQRLDQGRRMLGMAGLVGLALVLASAALHFAVTQPTEALAQARQRELAWQLAHPLPAARKTAAGDNAEQLARFYRQFPPATQLNATLAKLHRLARENGVGLRLGEYKLDSQGQGRFVRYEILLPVDAGYPQLRRFIAAAGREIATLGLKEISFKREKVDEQAVKTQLRFVLFLLRTP